MHERLAPPLPDPAPHNTNLSLYIQSIEQVATQRNYTFVNIFHPGIPIPLTSDGIQPTPYGYYILNAGALGGFGFDGGSFCRIELDAGGTVVAAKGTRVENVKALATGISFKTTDEMLPMPPPPLDGRSTNLTLHLFQMSLRVTGLPAGSYRLEAGGETLAAGTAKDWDSGINFEGGPAYAQAEALRKLIVAKNTDWFNRWRPANDTYLFGFRKHEQGRNAVEIPQFDPLIAQKEAEIAKAKVPRPVTYTLERQ